jgi:TRAP-type C4-dicarboxylate transport system substrate-binding protein
LGVNLKKTVFCALCALLVTGGIFAAPAKITIKVASVAPNRSPWDIEQRKLGQVWNKITEGLVTVQFFDAAAQGGEGAVIQKLRAIRPGQKPPLDGAIFTNIGLYSLAPETNILTLCTPFLFRNQDEVDYIFNRFKGEMAQAINQKGFTLLGIFPVGWIYFATKNRVETPEQLKNERLSLGGIGSAELTAAFKVAGFKVDNTPAEKISQSVKTPGGIQGVYAIPMYLYATKMHETLRYVLDLPICPVFSALFLSNDTWNAIPERYKPELLAELRKTEDTFLAVQKNNDSQYLKLMADAGVTLTKLTPEQLNHWETTLKADARRMAESGSSVIDLVFQERIMAALDAYRK